MIRLATKEARKSECSQKHGAILANKKAVLGKGHNTYKSHPKFSTRKIHSGTQGEFFTTHAEAKCIHDAVRKGINLKGSTIYVVRDAKNSKLSKPCPGCLSMIKLYGISKVVYTDKDGSLITIRPLW